MRLTYMVLCKILSLENWKNGKVSKSFLKDSDKEDNTYLAYSSSYNLIYSKYVSMTTRKYVLIPEISCSDLGLPTDGV